MPGINVTNVSYENGKRVETNIYLDYTKHSDNKDLLVLLGAIALSQEIEEALSDSDILDKTPFEVIKRVISIMCADVVLDMYKKMEDNEQILTASDEMLNIYNSFVSKNKGE